MKNVLDILEDRDRVYLMNYLTAPLSPDGNYPWEPVGIQDYERVSHHYTNAMLEFLAERYVDAFSSGAYNFQTGARLYHQIRPDNGFKLLIYFFEHCLPLFDAFSKNLLHVSLSKEQYHACHGLFHRYNQLFRDVPVFAQVSDHWQYALSEGTCCWIVENAWTHINAYTPSWKKNSILLTALEMVTHRPLMLLLDKALPHDEREVKFIQLAQIDTALAEQFWNNCPIITPQEDKLWLS